MRRAAAATLCLLLCGVLIGCAPSFEINPFENLTKASSVQPKLAPTIDDLVNHVSCELASDYKNRNATFPRAWSELRDYHYVAAIEMSLSVTHTEGFNPSASFITPLDYLGRKLGIAAPAKPTATSPNPTQPTATYGNTLAIGLQATGSQSRNYDLQYVLDMSRLMMQATVSDDALHGCAKSGGLMDLTDGLQGSLKLGEIVDAGLDGLSAAEYKQGLPVRFPGSPCPEGNCAGFLKSGAPKSAGQSSFSSQIDFSVVEGVNGGLTISTLDFKLGAGSGSGGTGGGNGGQMVNFSRSTTDSLIITFTATCRDDDRLEEMENGKFSSSNSTDIPLTEASPPVPIAIQLDSYDEIILVALGTIRWSNGIITNQDGQILIVPKIEKSSETSSHSGARVPGPSSFGPAGSTPISPPFGPGPGSFGPPPAVGVAGFGPPRADRIVEGSIKWVGNYDSSHNSVRIEGTVTNAQTQNAIGRIIVAGTIKPAKAGSHSIGVLHLDKVLASSGLIGRLESGQQGEASTAAYFEELPICSSSAGAASLQTRTDKAQSLNTILRLQQILSPNPSGTP